MGYVTDNPSAGGAFGAKKVRDSAMAKTDGFKKGGKAGKMYGGKSEKAGGGCMKKGGEVMSHAAKGKKPARATGGGVFSSAHSGSPRGTTPKPY
jgi:hypothetical protein